MTEAKQMTVAELKNSAGIKPSQEVVIPGFSSAAGMELLSKAANMLTFSDMVPEQYRTNIKKGNSVIVNDAGMANCVVALNMANAIGLDVLTVMQNLHVISGRPSWSAQFIIARLNNSGLFSRLRFDLSEVGEKVDFDYQVSYWEDKKKLYESRSATMRHQTCRAWAKDLETGEILKGTEVSVEMAIAEGWAKKDGSKWHTMQEQMLMYRAAAFFARIYAPELLAGLPTDDELRDVLEAEVVNGVMQVKPEPVTTEELRTAKKAKPEAEDVVMSYQEDVAEVAGSEPPAEETVPEAGKTEPVQAKTEPQGQDDKPVQRGRGRQSQQAFNVE